MLRSTIAAIALAGLLLLSGRLAVASERVVVLHAVADGAAILIAPDDAQRIVVTAHGTTRISGPATGIAWPPLGHAVTAVPLPPQLRRGDAVVVRLSPVTVTGAPRLIADDPVFDSAIGAARANGFIFGILAGAIMLQVAAFALTLEASIPWYIAFCLSVALIEAWHDGLFPGAHLSGSRTVLLSVLDVLNGIADTGFVIVFLRLWRDARTLFWATIATSGTMIALGVLSVTLSPLTALIAPIRNALLLTGFLTLFGVTIARGLAGFRPAWWLPPALLMLFFQPGYVLVRHAFGVNAPFLDRWAFEVGTLGDTFLFGLAILAHGRYVVLERRAIQRRLDEVTHDARHDALTGVLNRRGLFSSIGASGGRGTLFFVDLDNFKMINDRYGHATGDAVLKQVAKAIRETVAEDDVVARIGGDEFVVVTREVERGPADRLAWRLASRIATLGPEDAEPHNRFGASIGYVDFDGIHFENALRRADSEAYHIKAEKRQRVLG